ncbi:uncharacterized protein LOC6566998 [Drosophila grimshawi]|uniref:GH13444 n=1 Tax=Drosophila grimshawi TaxID=7222 RepID=B4JP94_DROGR|nr:uncharacterized protein LOC6566998 [Drosophila grimshawi]EDV98724.1 GH13444 [Drosophila grimshawi]
MPNSCQSERRWTLLLCLGLAALIPTAAAMRCKVPYEKVQEHYCYFIADGEPLMSSFSNFCYREKRTSRVCLDSEAEMHVLANYLYANGYQDGTQFWSAGHRWPGDMRFYWNYFGRARALNYTNWLEGEPTPQMGRNCMLLTLRAGELFMTTESCHTRAVDICEQLLTNEPTIMH